MISKKKLYAIILSAAVVAVSFGAFLVSYVQSDPGGPTGTYALKYTTGPFMLPASTHSLNWNLLNNDNAPQTARVTIFKCNIGSEKTVEPPGPIEVTLDPNETTHNANEYEGGFVYEILVETNSKKVFPSAEAWPGSMGDVIPGSEIRAAQFIRIMP